MLGLFRRRFYHYKGRAGEWAAKAELALTKDREDLARGALAAKQQAEQMSDVVKLDEAKAKHKALMMRTTVATGQIRMRTVLKDSKVDDALARYERMERKVDELEAHVEAFDLGSGESLESQFAALEADEAIEDELAALKASLKAPAKKAANK